MARTATKKKIHPNLRKMKGRKYSTNDGLVGCEGVPMRLRKPISPVPKQTDFDGVRGTFHAILDIELVPGTGGPGGTTGEKRLIVRWLISTGKAGRKMKSKVIEYRELDKFFRAFKWRVDEAKGETDN